jgi:hypothetical protein
MRGVAKGDRAEDPEAGGGVFSLSRNAALSQESRKGGNFGQIALRGIDEQWVRDETVPILSPRLPLDEA